MPKKNSTSSGKESKPKTQPVGWIWPKDPQPGNPSSWPRFKRFSDVISGKGPDIFIGTIGRKPKTVTNKDMPGRSVSSTNWARWDVEPEEDDSPFPWARREKDVKYDYKTRKYVVPDDETWSAVEYADCEWDNGKWRKRKVTPSTPIRYWDRHDRVHWCQKPEQVIEERVEDAVGGDGVPNGRCNGHCHPSHHGHKSGVVSPGHLHTHTLAPNGHCHGCCCEGMAI